MLFDNQFVAEKTLFCINAGLKVILCCGESEKEREAGETKQVVYRQLDAVAHLLKDLTNIVIAYEPVWAIGTGKVATPQQAQEAHADIRQWLAKKYSHKVADVTRVIYGGSVNGNNCNELAQQPDVDGFLVGGASLKPEFTVIIAANAEKKK